MSIGTNEILLDQDTNSNNAAKVLRGVSAYGLTHLRAGLLLESILGIICLGLEIEILEQLDSLVLYLTYYEIAADIGVALILLCCLGIAWWLLTLLMVQLFHLTSWTKNQSKTLAWYLGLGVPLAYLELEAFGAVRLRFFSNWHQTLLAWVCLGLGLVGVGLGSIRMVGLLKLQDFCRTRLAPIAWLHIACGLVAVIMLRADGVYLFRDYANPGRNLAASSLPDVYLITMDALRADDMSVYGYTRPTTPNLEKFARTSFVFDYCFSNANFTTPATTSIETGELPWSHRLFQAGAFPSNKAQGETLPSVLRQHGYYTAMITSNYLASPVKHRTIGSYDSVQYAAPVDATGPWLQLTNLVGLDTQYTLYTSLLKGLGGIRFYLGTLIWRHEYPYPPEPVFDRARALLERRDITQPRFVWTHIFPPHDPYLPPPPYRTFLTSNKLTKTRDFIGLRNTTRPGQTSVSELRARYDELIAYGDHVVGQYLDWLDRTGRLDHSIVIISADHGESFEHDWLLHTGPYLTDGLIHIPLLIHLPGQKQGAHIAQPAEEADILPTILDLVGLKIPDWTDGASLKAALSGRKLNDRFIYSMDLERNSVFKAISTGTVVLMDDEFKYVYQLDSRRESLYRYRADQGETRDLDQSEPDVAMRMRSALFDKLREVNQRAIPGR